MSVEVAGYRSRKRKNEAKRAAKEKKEKILLAVCGAVLLGLVAFQGPKILKRSHGSSAAPAASASSTSTAAATAQAKTLTTAASKVDATKHLAAKDPFVSQLATDAAPVPATTAETEPAVRQSNFVKKDPFIQQVAYQTAPPVPSTTPATRPAGKPGHGKAQPASGKAKRGGNHKSESNGNYIVMVASIPISEGGAAAHAAAAAARSSGVASVKIVDSSRYPTLRTGFYAVYSGPYPTLAALQPALEQVRGQGYPSAYTRRLAH